jgi:hypothetical protein
LEFRNVQELKANTEVKVVVGPFVDKDDGLTPETGVTLGAADEAELLKHGSDTVTDISGATWAAISNADGYYVLTLTSALTDTEGMLTVVVNDDSVCLPVLARFMVLSQAAYDSKYAAKDSGYMDVDVKAVSASTTAADNAEIVFDTDFSTNYSTDRDAWVTNQQDTVGTGNLTADVIAISGSSTAADNAEIVYDTDFGTNYNTTRDAWVTNQEDTVGTGNFTVDVIEISGDANAANNLETAFDGGSYDIGGIDVSELNTASGAIGSDGSGLTEAGGDGDHLTEAGGDGDHLVEAGGTGDQFTGIPEVDADVVKISGDSTAADNLEAMYDGDGYVADTAPASRAQVSGVQASSGAFIASTIADNNITGTDPLNGVTKVAAATTGNVTDLTSRDDVGLEVPNDTNEIDIVFQINVPANAVPLSVLFDGHINGANDTCPIKVYDHDNTAWVTVATIVGQAGSANTEIVAPLGESRYASSTGAVYIRFDSTGTGQSLFLDRVAVEYTNQTVGYANGAIWVNTNASNTNTTAFVDGTADNPVSTWAAALTLSSSLGLKKFQLVSGSSITLTANSDSYEIIGFGSSVALNGQSVSGALFEGCSISGNDDGSNASPVRFRNCSIGTCTLGNFRMNQCPLTGTITLAEAATYILEQCLCSCTGGSSPGIDVGAAVGDTTVSIRHWSGSMEVQNMGQSGTDLFSMQGWGKLTINANCTGGTVNLHGHIVLANNGSGQTINDNARIDQASILEAVTDDDTKLDGSSLNAIEGKVDTVDGNVDSILTDTGEIGAAGAGLSAIPWNSSWDAEVQSEVADALEATIDDSIPADGSRPSVKQGIYMLTQFMTERSISSTTMTVKKPDGSTSLFTLTLDDDTTPTSVTRAT